MSVRVELIDDAIADLAKHAESGKLKAFFAKLLEIEQKLGPKPGGIRTMFDAQREEGVPDVA